MDWTLVSGSFYLIHFESTRGNICSGVTYQFFMDHFRSCLFCMIIVATDMSAVVRYFTRFTEEAFAALIGIIFVYEALKKLFSKFDMID